MEEKGYEEIFDENGAMKVDQSIYTGPTTKAKRKTLLVCGIVVISIALKFV